MFCGSFVNLEPCLIGIEACHSSHYWARELIALGHDVRLIPTQYVRPFRRGGKERRQRCRGDMRCAEPSVHQQLWL